MTKGMVNVNNLPFWGLLPMPSVTGGSFGFAWITARLDLSLSEPFFLESPFICDFSYSF